MKLFKLKDIKINITVVLYTGNVCSTPFVNAFKRLGGVCVPIHEHLDKYYISNKFPEDDAGKIFSHVLRSLAKREYSKMVRQLETSRPKLLDIDVAPNMYFKWRPFRSEDDDVYEEQKRVLKDLDVEPIFILRKSIVEQCLKIVMNEKHYQTRHPQFKAVALSAEDYDYFVLQQSKLRLEISDEDIVRTIKETQIFINRTRHSIAVAKELFTDKQLKLVITESIFKPMIDDEEFLKFCHLDLSLENSNLEGDGSFGAISRKAGLSMSNFINADILKENSILVGLESEYSTLIDTNFNN
jgi:hypothetical protein